MYNTLSENDENCLIGSNKSLLYVTNSLFITGAGDLYKALTLIMGHLCPSVFSSTGTECGLQCVEARQNLKSAMLRRKFSVPRDLYAGPTEHT
jgi:hypothetical protein